MYLDLPVKYQFFISDFNETWIFLSQFLRHTQIPDFMKICPVGAKLFHADERTDRRDDALQFCKWKHSSKPTIQQHLSFKMWYTIQLPEWFIISDYISYSSSLRHQTIIQNCNWKFYLRLTYVYVSYSLTGQVLARDKAPNLQTGDGIICYQVRATAHIRRHC